MTVSVGLVGCGKGKLSCPSPARQLYTGALVRAASRYAARTYDMWWIVSACYWLVHPDDILDPYDQQLPTGTEAAHWALTVDWMLRQRPAGHGPSITDLLAAGEDVEVHLHAGRAYRAALTPVLARWAAIRAPLAGLGIGEQLAWYRSAQAAPVDPTPPPVGAGGRRRTLGRDDPRRLGGTGP